MARIHSFVSVGREAVRSFFADDCMTLSASMAFYTLFAIPPLAFLLVMIISTGMSVVVDPDLADKFAREFLQRQASNLIGIKAAAVEIGKIIQLSRNQSGASWQSLLSLLGVLVAATGLMSALQSALNRVWGVKPLETSSRFVWKRFISLTLILGFAFLLIVSFILARVIEMVTEQVSSHFAVRQMIPTIMNHAVNALTTWACFAAIFRFMPDARVPWKHAIVGGLVTFLLFILGQAVLYAYLSLGNPAEQLGSAAASLVVILLWIYYSSSILLFGAEFTRLMTTSATVTPELGAVRVEERETS